MAEVTDGDREKAHALWNELLCNSEVPGWTATGTIAAALAQEREKAREAAYWTAMDAADVWMSHDKRARASVVCDYLIDLGNDIKWGRPFRHPVAYVAYAVTTKEAS